MKQKEYEEIVTKICPNSKQYISPEHIESIILKNGMIIRPDWKYNRISCDKKGIYILNGSPVPYGGRLPKYFSLTFDRYNINFPGEISVDTKNYGEYRIPKTGDIIVYSMENRVISKSTVLSVSVFTNTTIIDLARPLSGPLGGLLSFYDPEQYDNDICMHSKYYEGIYLRFKPDNNEKYSTRIKPSKIEKIIFKDGVR